jgi:putative transposase
MPRAPRDYGPGLHHVWVNATGHEAYFVDEIDRLAWIRQLVRTLDLHPWRCIAFVQLDTHVHLILQTDDWSLPLGMKRLNLEYSKDFNIRHTRRGQFVRCRYGNRRIRTGQDLVGVYAYVILNPVKAGLAPRAEDWRWSSYPTTLGISHDFPFVDASPLLAELGGSVDALRAAIEARHRAHLSRTATSGA